MKTACVGSHYASPLAWTAHHFPKKATHLYDRVIVRVAVLTRSHAGQCERVRSEYSELCCANLPKL